MTDSASERSLVLLAGALLAARLYAYSGWESEAAALLLLCASLAIYSPRIRNSAARCHFRTDASSGLALGCCSPGLLVGAITAVRLHSIALLGPLRLHFWTAIGCAIQPPLAMLIGGSPLPAAAGAHALALAVGTLPTFILAGSAASVVMLFALGVHATALDWALARLRGCFTLGEAATIAQGVALLSIDTLVMTACASESAPQSGGKGIAEKLLASTYAGSSGAVSNDPRFLEALCVPRSTDALATEALLAGGIGLSAALAILLTVLRHPRVAPYASQYARSAAFVAGAALALGTILLPWLSSLVRADALMWLLTALTLPGRPALIAYWAGTIPLACAAAAWLAPASSAAAPPAASGAASATAAAQFGSSIGSSIRGSSVGGLEFAGGLLSKAAPPGSEDGSLIAHALSKWPEWRCDAYPRSSSGRFEEGRWWEARGREEAAEERCYITAGRASLQPYSGGPAVEIAKGEWVTFRRGFLCTWVVHEAVSKRYAYFDSAGCELPTAQVVTTGLKPSDVAEVVEVREQGADAASSRRARLLLARKVYHFYAVGLFAPGVLYHPSLLQIAMACVLPVFLLLEVIRVEELPPLAQPIATFLATFLDSRDAGTLILTHVYLLLGCAVPIWLDSALPPAAEEALAARAGSVAAVARAAAPYAGLLVLGIGDAMASVVGVYAGRTRWPRSRKTLEGSAAGVASMLLVLALLLSCAQGGVPRDLIQWAVLSGCTALACVLEAATSQIDNLFLPLFFQTLLLIAAAGPW